MTMSVRTTRCALLMPLSLLCRQLDLFGRELLAVDGTRIKAVNTPRMAYLIKRFLGFRIGAGSGEPTPGARMLPAIPRV